MGARIGRATAVIEQSPKHFSAIVPVMPVVIEEVTHPGPAPEARRPLRPKPETNPAEDISLRAEAGEGELLGKFEVKAGLLFAHKIKLLGYELAWLKSVALKGTSNFDIVV